MAQGKQSLKTVAEAYKNKYGEGGDRGNFFPSDDIDPKLKKGAWCRAWSESIWTLFVRNGAFTSLSRFERYELLRLYGAGQQPREKYMDWLLDDINENPTRKGYLSTNWDIFSPMPKFKRIIRGRFESQDYEVVATAVDPMSTTEREDMMWESWYKSNFGRDEEEIMALSGVPAPQKVEYVANTLEELEMFNKIGGFKLKKEIEIETALDYTDYISDFKQIKRKLIDDFVDINCAAYRDYYDPIDKRVKYEYVDFANLIIDHSRELDFKDARFWGYVKWMTINEIRAIRPDIPEYDLQQTALGAAGMFGNLGWDFVTKNSFDGYLNKDGAYVYDQFRVPVLISEWLSNDSTYKMNRTNKRGETLYMEQDEWGKKYNTEKKKTVVIQAPNVYTCHWIIGTDIIFNDGVAMNAARVEKKFPKLSIHAYCLTGTSIVESVIPNLDQIQLTKVRMESAIASSAPPGLMIEFGALSNLDLGDGNMKPLNVLKMYEQNGKIIYNATLQNGQFRGSSTKPIEKLEGGMGAYFNELVASFELHFNFISEITGIDRVSAASQKPGETSATEIKIASASTNDALQPLFQGYISLKEMGAITAACRIQMAVKYNPEAYDTYYPVLGKANLEIMKISRDVVDAMYGIKIQAKPTAEMKNAIMTAATESLKPGKDGEKLTWSDWMLIQRLVEQGNLKQAEAIINYRTEISREQALKLQRDNMKLNGENMVAAEQKKTEGQIAITRAQEEEKRKTALLESLLKETETTSATIKQAKASILETFAAQMLQNNSSVNQPVN